MDMKPIIGTLANDEVGFIHTIKALAPKMEKVLVPVYKEIEQLGKKPHEIAEYANFAHEAVFFGEMKGIKGIGLHGHPEGTHLPFGVRALNRDRACEAVRKFKERFCGDASELSDALKSSVRSQTDELIHKLSGRISGEASEVFDVMRDGWKDTIKPLTTGPLSL